VEEPVAQGISFGPIGNTAVHLCVDMQRMFAEPTAWTTPWMARVLPRVVTLAERQPARNVFTRFIPAAEPGTGPGTWRRYYERWPEMTRSRLPEGMLDLLPELASFVPPGWLIDKQVYGPWMATDLHQRLRGAGIDTLVVSGGETEVCVLATVLGAIDLGYRIVIATDALCSSADDPHDAMLSIYESRYGMQVEAAETDEIVDSWR
jgi:nicotinamidase-related amidase